MIGPLQDVRPRRAYLDWARGLAVLVMIEAHTLDAWTRAADRHGVLFRDLTVLGGFAAPLFLWIAGVVLVLAAERKAQRTGRASGVEAACRRGLEIFILAFLFRLQGFIITPGGSPVTLFRVDVLNIMGPSIVIVALLWGAGRTAGARVVLCAAMAIAAAVSTPIVRASSSVNLLPVWLQWYVRPAGDLTIFTFFPWAGFVFAGGAVGVLVAAARDTRAETRMQIALGIVGTALIAVGFFTAGRPSIYRASSFWTSSPTWFAIRVGVLMAAVTGMFVVSRLRTFSSRDPLAVFGRSSLFVYWIHVELVYGYASWLWRHRLPLWGTVLAYAAFCTLMYAAIVLRDRLVAAWRARQVGLASREARPAEAASRASA